MSWPACPECGAETKCLDSRPVGYDAVRRRYQCVSGKHRWSTMEKIAQNVDRFAETLMVNGKTKSLREWAKVAGISPGALLNRLLVQKLSPDVAVSKARRRRGRWLQIVAKP